jgi:peptide/nickel transport system substrate-binding protein
VDWDQLKPYQWSSDRTQAIADANAALDAAGWVKGSDGIRAKGGNKLSFKIECPTGWTDWMASLEVVATSAKEIGIDIQTYYPEMAIAINDVYATTFDIIMWSVGATGISSPWTRAYQGLGSADMPPEGTVNNVQSFGRWENARANQLVAQAATETDPAKLKALWTEMNILYLQELPFAGLMYRPGVFHTVNETVWTGFPTINDGSNIPPTICADGYGVAALYNIRLK